MDKRTYRLPTPEHAEFIVSTLAPNVLVVAEGREVTLGERSLGLLRALPEDHDGHIDADGVMWIGGTDYPPQEG